MLQKLTISSSSFLLPKHPAWDLLSNKYNIDYKYIGNFSGALLSKSDDQILVSILFLLVKCIKLNGGLCGDRTHDLMIKSHPLYQLS